MPVSTIYHLYELCCLCYCSLVRVLHEESDGERYLSLSENLYLLLQNLLAAVV